MTTRYVLTHRAGYFYTAARSPVTTVVVRRSSSLSIRLAGTTVSGTLDGQGAGALAGRTVTLFARPTGTSQAFAAVSSATTNKNGYVAFAVAPSASTDYQLSFAGGSAFDGCQSGIVTYTTS